MVMNNCIVLLTGKNISGVLLLLAMNEKTQDKLVNELKEILSSDDDEVDEASLAKMTFLEQVIKEAARLIPPILMIARETTANIKLG